MKLAALDFKAEGNAGIWENRRAGAITERSSAPVEKMFSEFMVTTAKHETDLSGAEHEGSAREVDDNRSIPVDVGHLGPIQSKLPIEEGVDNQTKVIGHGTTRQSEIVPHSKSGTAGMVDRQSHHTDRSLLIHSDDSVERSHSQKTLCRRDQDSDTDHEQIGMTRSTAHPIPPPSSPLSATSQYVIPNAADLNLQSPTQAAKQILAHLAKPVVELCHLSIRNHRVGHHRQLTFGLYPVHLGEIQIRLRLEGGRLSVVIVPELKQTGDLLQQDVNMLRSALSGTVAGAASTDIAVSVGLSPHNLPSTSEQSGTAPQLPHGTTFPGGENLGQRDGQHTGANRDEACSKSETEVHESTTCGRHSDDSLMVL